MNLDIKPKLDDPASIAMVARLPGCGQAAALIRRVDPLWGVARDCPGGKPVWTVYISRGEGECPYCHCDCNSDTEEKEIEVAASSKESAERKAQRIMDADTKKYGGFEIESVAAPAIPEAPVPDELEAAFETPEAYALRKAAEAKSAAIVADAMPSQHPLRLTIND